MKIRGQKIRTDKTSVCLTLHLPYWSAWKKYGWKESIWGIGVAIEIIVMAVNRKKKINVDCGKYGVYEIGYGKALKWIKKTPFIAKDKKIIVVIPYTEFKHIKKEKPKPKTEREEYYEFIRRIHGYV
jgi:hypothetical protein